MNFYIKIYNFVTSSKSKRLLLVVWRGWFGDRKGIRPAKTWVLVRWWGWCDWALQVLRFGLPWRCHLHHVFCSKIQEVLTFSYLLTLIVKKTGWWTDCMCQWCGLRLSVLEQDRSETKKSVLVFQVWCCVVKHGLVSHTRPHNDLEGYSNLSSTIYGFSILLLHHLQWRSTVAFTYLKVKSAKCLCLLLVVLVLDLFTLLVCVHRSEWVQGLTFPSTHYWSFWRRVFPVNHLYWWWQTNKNNQETEHTNNIKMTQPKKESLVNSTTHTSKEA